MSNSTDDLDDETSSVYTCTGKSFDDDLTDYLTDE